MIEFSKFTLNNGLTLIVHTDTATPMCVVNVLYNVGSRNEQADKTGFAHLFEHLMFGGSKNAPDFDEPLQRAGGESNAFTNSDITNYYNVLPAENIETALWLESDRMLQLNINEQSLDVQRKVVCEEFKENFLNQPYGDVWHQISKLAYKVHPYNWPTIGKELSHVEDAKLDDVQHFFNTHYNPNNAIMVVSGPVKETEVLKLVEKWFGNIPAKGEVVKQIPEEPKQNKKRFIKLKRDVPINAIYMIYHMDKRDSDNYYALDLMTDILSSGASSRLYRKLVKEQKLFMEIDAYVTGSIDKGLVIIEGKMNEKVSMLQAEEAINIELEKVLNGDISNHEFEKVKNKQEAYTEFSEINLLNRTMNLAFYELLGDAERINTELERYSKISMDNLVKQANLVFKETNSSVIHYYSNQK